MQDNAINGYKILDHRKKDLYEIIAKTAAIRSHFRVRRTDGVAVATINQGQLEHKYEILGVQDQLLCQLEYKQEKIFLDIAGQKYEAKAIARAKEFIFNNSSHQMVMTVDKKLVSKSDNYHIIFVEDFPSLVAAVIGVILDDIYHKGLIR